MWARGLVADTITLGTFLIAFQLATFSTQLSGGLDGIISTWQYFRSTQDRLREVIEMGGGESTTTRAGGARFELPPLDEATGITLDDVDVLFDGRLVLDGLRVTPRPARWWRSPGPPGSGKSTVATLACGLVQPNRGHVLVDGVDLAGLDGAHMGQAMRIVSEEPFLFADTLAENLLLGGHGDEAEAPRRDHRGRGRRRRHRARWWSRRPAR